MTTFNYTVGFPSPTLPSGWASTGCITDAGSIRALAEFSFTSSSMTAELCMTTCLKSGYSLAGTEYASECYCGSSYTVGSVTSTGCNMKCAGGSNHPKHANVRQLY